MPTWRVGSFGEGPMVMMPREKSSSISMGVNAGPGMIHNFRQKRSLCSIAGRRGTHFECEVGATEARGLVGIGSRGRTTVLVRSREPLVIRLQSAILRADWACPGGRLWGPGSIGRLLWNR